VDVERAARVELVAVLAAGETALHPARARLDRAMAAVVALAALRRRIVHSVRRASGDPSLPRTPSRVPSSGSVCGLLDLVLWAAIFG